jgi:nitronate monooxygenase
MAGGPSTPALAAAVTNAGGLGFLAAGYLTPQRVAEAIAAARALTGGPIGVNLFVPQPCVAGADQLDRYRELLMPLARHYGVEPGDPHPDDDGWQAKLDVVLDLAPEAVSFTFGCPEPAVLARLRGRGSRARAPSW